MKAFGIRLSVAAMGALLLLAGAAGAHAQGNAAAPANPPPTIGPPQLRDFSIQPRQRIVTQPAPTQAQPPPIAAPPPVATAPQQRAATVRPTPEARSPAAVPAPAPRPAAPATQSIPSATPTPAQPAPQAQPGPEAPAAKRAPPPPPESSAFPWAYAIPAALLALLAFALIRRRRRSAEIVEAVEAVAPEVSERAHIGARPEPVPRPWLELELKAERLASTDAESVVQFELEIVNNGTAPARNLRVDVKMFNAGQEQDKEIGAFFRVAGRESTKCSLPGVRADTTVAIRGEVAMARADMRAVVLENKYLFIPVIAVNVLYDWGDGRTGQTSKSYVVGRELEQPSDKMGAFRVDLGPRIWRTVGQRQHKLARRV
jgi:MYXO-CTERM domain-containing protein